MNPALEQALVQHCAATLLGVKAGSLVSLSNREIPGLTGELSRYNMQLRPCGLVFVPMCQCRERTLVLVFRPDDLERRLSDPEARRILDRAGYPVVRGVGALVAHLRRRLAEQQDFPHEIGLFLDYPTEDVAGFLRDGGAGSKFCGYWKVYGDVDAAKARFASFDACRDCLARQLREGETISTLLGAA
ncbi:DUF3793 family protein [Pseudoflavonifractor phocaeensis]|uniref:DUF3793 family protein n=1 Tax=Pseudoflavonifractor phocaeensis TaxID=1870988 RepID=UPI001959E9EC|nr:DUF3793 family protein [Pseudoflavonifractor phocaeensis]MBM6938546.1 DUF3793 family protein [Pseudoflavonifractor phocaeensis]